MSTISKAIVGSVAGGISGAITPALIIPADVSAPWWGYVVAYAVGSVLTFAGVYFAPANRRRGA